MIKFLIKKSFFDGWDNLIPSFVYNICCMTIIATYVFVVSLITDAQVFVFFGVTAGFLLIYCIFNFGLSALTFNWGNYQSSWGRGFFEKIKTHVPHVIVFYLSLLVCFFCIAIVIPTYLESQSFTGLFLAFILLWVILFFTISLQYYVPLCSFLDGRGPFFIIKQCFILALDNKLFTLFVTVKTIFDFLLSALSFFFIPGLSFISLSHVDAVKLLHLRYRWMNEHGIKNKKDVNVYNMLEEERKDLGKRSLRGMIKPWKDEK